MYEAPYPLYHSTDKAWTVWSSFRGLYSDNVSYANKLIRFLSVLRESLDFWHISIHILLSSYETAPKWWSIILTSVIDNVYRVNDDLGCAQETTQDARDKTSEGKAIIEKLEFDMSGDCILE